MIVTCNREKFALTEDGYLYVFSLCVPNPPMIDATNVEAVHRMHYWIDIPLILTKEKRFLLHFYLQNKFIDVTEKAGICIDFTSYCCCKTGFMVLTRNQAQIIIFGVGGLGSYPAMTLHGESFDTVALDFEEDINLSSFGYGHGFFRTKSGLYNINVFGYRHGEGSNINPYLNYEGFTKGLVSFEHVDCISEIVSGMFDSLFLMNDGSVWVCNYNQAGRTLGILSIVPFSDDSFIIKIITDGIQFFFIADDGSCYYANSKNDGTSDGPLLIRALSNYHTENLFILDSLIVVIHSEGICLLDMVSHISYPFSTSLCKTYIMDPSYTTSDVEPETIQFKPEMPIVSVTGTRYDFYFLLENGSLHQLSDFCFDDTEVNAVPFFTDNPVKIDQRKSVMQIRSASSIVNEID